MIFTNFISLLFVYCQIYMLSCDGKDTESYLIEQSNVRGVKDGKEVRWTLDLNGSYIIQSVRINASLTNYQTFWMSVNNVRRAPHVCNETFIEGYGIIIIKCSDPIVIGCRLTIITSFSNEDQIIGKVLIDICTNAMYPLIESEFQTDGSVKGNALIDGNIQTCLPFKEWLNYKHWILITLNEEIFVEALAVLGSKYEPMKDFNVQITNQTTVSLLNESLCELSKYHIFTCNKMGRHVLLLKNEIVTNQNDLACEISIFGYVKNDNREKVQRGCYQIFKTYNEDIFAKGTWTIPSTIICLLLLLISFVTWGVYRLKPRFWQHITDAYLRQDLQTNKLQHLIYRKLLYGDFEKEFSKLPKEDIKPSSYGLYLHHLAKNRFRNVIPFDENLVKLENYEHDYINASFIRGSNGDPNAYIATQGPKKNTTNDFWFLVWQYKVETIVMLTQLIETCSNKCVQYWPDCNQSEAIFGRISVTIVKESRFADYVCRYLVLKMVNQCGETPRAVVHMQFMAWSDYRTPNYCFPLLDFRERVDCLQKYSKSPLLVHCSAGVGRTGAYIAIDYLIKQAENEGKVSVYKCVKDLRFQRMKMVQNKEQYIFIYKTVAESSVILKTRIHCGDFMRKFNVFIDQQSIQTTTNVASLIMEESVKLFQVLKKVTQVSYGKTSEVDDHRLIVKGGSTGYINAVSIQCHKTSNAHVLTQIPLPETRSDFWHMLWEHDLRQVLLLEDDKGGTLSNKYTTYWPENNAISFETLTICLTLEKSNDYYVVRKFLLLNSANDEEEKSKEVTQYHVTKNLWPEYSQVPANKHQFQKMLKQLLNCNGRTVLQCLNGSSRSGLAAAAMLMIDMMLLDETVDPFLACRYVLASRPEAIPTQEQYSFLYEMALACIEDSGNYAFVRSSDYELERERH